MPVFPQYPKKLNDPGPEYPPEGNRKWGARPIYRAMRGWMYPYLRSRVLAGDFHPITSYLFVKYKCNLDCWYCWSFDNRIKGMTEDVARRSIDWLYDHGCRVLACMGGEPLLRPDFIRKFVYNAAFLGLYRDNGRLLKPELADRLGDTGVAVFNFALDSWELKPQSAESVYSRADQSRTHFAEAIRLRLPGLFEHQNLPQQSPTFATPRCNNPRVCTRRSSKPSSQ